MLEKNEKPGITDRFLNRIEKTGNKLPQPIILFFLLSIAVLFLSWFVSLFEISVTHPGTGQTIEAVNLLSKYGIRRIFTEAVSNFTGFAPLGVVLVAMLGVGIAERSGLISALLKKTVLSAPDRYITAVVIFAGIMSNIASDAGYVVLVPLGAVIFAAKGRHPLVGLAAAFAGVSGGFSANLLISTLDPLLAGLSQEAAQLIDSGYSIPPTVNYYFMVASTFIVTIIGTWVTERIVAPRFGEYHGDHEEELEEISAAENEGIKSALIWLGIALAIILLMTVPQNGILRSDQGNLIMGSTPFVGGMVPLIAIFFLVPGIAYGKKTGSIENTDDIGIGTLVSTMVPYSLAFLVGWTILLIIWYVFKLPIGPGGILFY